MSSSGVLMWSPAADGGAARAWGGREWLPQILVPPRTSAVATVGSLELSVWGLADLQTSTTAL